MSEYFASLTPHVLLVEDNAGEILLVSESFREFKQPYRLSVARDGQEAIDFMYGIGHYAGMGMPDLILLDLNLPKLGGHDVLAHLKGNAQFRNIPVLILSTSNARPDIERAYELGANCYIRKPGNLDDFFHLMRVVREFWLKLAVVPAANTTLYLR